MRFGTGEKINITNLAIPNPITPSDNKDIFGHANLEYLQNILRQPTLENGYKVMFLAMVKMFFLKDGVLTPEEEIAIWNLGEYELTSIRLNCTDKRNNYYNWDTYIQWLSYLEIINPQKTRELVVNKKEWDHIQGRLDYYRKNEYWGYFLKYCRAIKIFDLRMISNFDLTYTDWHKAKAQWLGTLELARRGVNDVDEKLRDTVQFLADARILYPRQFDELTMLMNSDDWEKIVHMAQREERQNTQVYFEILSNMRIIFAERAEVTPSGLIIEVKPQPQNTDQAATTNPPLKRNF